MAAEIHHLIPEAALSNSFHGSYKDVISRVRFFESSESEYFRHEVSPDDPGVVSRLSVTTRSPAILVEYSHFPKVVRECRRRWPEARIIVRSHNLEPLQHFDNYGWWPSQGPLWVAYGMVRLLRNDLIVKKYASAIWSISDWENRVYWNRLPGKAKVEWLPYFCPDHLLPDCVAPADERVNIVCMPTSQKNRKSWDLVTRFIRFAEQMKAVSGCSYNFLVTGRVNNWGLPKSDAVRFTGMIDDLRPFMQTVRAVALLSDKGYGFKTTISDATASGAAVLAHPKLAARCPNELAEAIIPVDVDDGDDVRAVRDRLVDFSPLVHIDHYLRAEAVRQLKALTSNHCASSSGESPVGVEETSAIGTTTDPFAGQDGPRLQSS
ncbi:MAG: hypothetical protein Fues2KO_26190 [Fuerstiella sp.]